MGCGTRIETTAAAAMDEVAFVGRIETTAAAAVDEVAFVGRIETTANEYCLQMDNAPWHTSRNTQRFIEDNGITYYPTPAQSPDFNPIELVWNDLKDFIRTEVQPVNKAELIAGIHVFWQRVVTVEYCNSKIDHLKTVLPRAIQLSGKPTGL